MMNLHGLFPTPIGFFNIDRPLTDSELQILTSQPQRPNMGNTSSEDRHVLDQPGLEQFRDFIHASMNEFFYTVHSPKTDVRLRITQSWTNHTKPGQFHHKHAHPNSYVSGVFYIQTDPARDRIYFYRDGYQQLKLRAAEFNPYNSESWWFEAEPGKLIMFPSSLTHMVETLPEDAGTRISLSFNTFLTGDVGDDYELTELIL